LDGREPGGQHVEHVGIELHPHDKNCDGDTGQHRDAAPDEAAPLCHQPRNEVTDTHGKAGYCRSSVRTSLRIFLATMNPADTATSTLGQPLPGVARCSPVRSRVEMRANSLKAIRRTRFRAAVRSIVRTETKIPRSACCIETI